ncbi:hypothetical protein [Rosenbergiella collisarenosi]|uniref:hypothetical protein n=1 Tax=Rosenbergiella collisarenosi TaxID=1544695 RepID=UPI001F4E4F85|nr:hypothetical protein [Rosenbergiella collisarenosi]
MALNNTMNAVGPDGSADPRDLQDNARVLDLLINGTADEVASRLGISLESYSALVKKMEASGGVLAYSNATTLLSSKPSNANTLALDSSTGTYYIWSGSSWAIAAYKPYERINTIRSLAESNRWASATQPLNINDHYLVPGIYYDANGVRTVDSSGAWLSVIVPVEIGDKISAYFQTGDSSSGVSFVYATQLDENSVFSSNIGSAVTTGSLLTINTTVTATINGFVALRIRLDGVGYYSVELTKPRSEFVDAKYSFTAQQVYGEVINAGGALSVGNAGVIAYYIPVEAGDEVNFSGRVGHTAGTDYMVIAQCDASKNYISALATEASSTTYKFKQYSVKAISRGYIYVRSNLGLTRSLTYARKTNVRNNALEKDLERNIISSERDHYYETGLIFSSTGVRTEASTATADWRAYWIPVKKGDVLTYRGYMGDSSTGSAFAVMNQHDRNGNFIANIATYTTTGARVLGSIKGKAIADGLVYVRVYALSGITTKQPFSIKVIPRKALGLHANTIKAVSSLDLLPILLDGTEGYNMAPFSQDNIQHYNGYLYCVVIGQGGIPFILKKPEAGGVWQSYNLGGITGKSIILPNSI